MLNHGCGDAETDRGRKKREEAEGDVMLCISLGYGT